MVLTRRSLIIASLATTSVAWAASSKVWRVGYLYPGDLDNPSDRAGFNLFRSELGRLGFHEGDNLVIDPKYARGQPDTLVSLAQEMVDARPDVIVAIATPAIAAAQKVTATVPIVMMPATDPIGSGFVKSLAKPGGNITGMANMYGDSVGKTVELLHSLLPDAKRIAVLMSSNPTHPQQLEIATGSLKRLGLVAVPVSAPSQDDLPKAFQNIQAEGCDALFVLADPVRPPIVTLAARAKIPAIYQYAGFVEMGGFASYGAEFSAILRKGAEYTVRIIKGAKPSETPVEQPIVFELVINLKTAKELGVKVPDAILVRADRVIE